MSVFTFAVGDRIEYFGDLASVVDSGGHGVGRLETVQSHSIAARNLGTCPASPSSVQPVTWNNRWQCSRVE